MVMASMRDKLIILSFSFVLIGIGVLSLIPPKSVIELGDHDKWNHFLAYSILTLNWCSIKTTRTCFLIGLVATFFYGLTLEFLQGIVPGRDPSWLDALANTGGVVIGFIVYSLFKRNTD